VRATPGAPSCRTRAREGGSRQAQRQPRPWRKTVTASRVTPPDQVTQDRSGPPAPPLPPFARRDPGYSLLIVSQWPDLRETEPNIAWAKETFEALQPYMANRSYVNNLTAEDGRLVRHLWGANYERLVTAKRRYDPDNIFRLNHNISPSA